MAAIVCSDTVTCFRHFEPEPVRARPEAAQTRKKSEQKWLLRFFLIMLGGPVTKASVADRGKIIHRMKLKKLAVKT